MKKIIISILLIAGVLITNMLYLTFFFKSSNANDHYGSMTQLMKATKEGVDWKIFTKDEHNPTVIVAPHGGGIEPGTTEIAGSIAKKANAGFYTFQGIRPQNNSELHVTSINYDEPKAREMIGQSERTVTIHKTGREGADVYIGGRDTALKHKIMDSLTHKGFIVKEANGNIAGEGIKNITNMNKRQAGVQLEVSNSTIHNFFKNGDSSRVSRIYAANWTNTMERFTDGVAEALKS
ncbi:hypothetical protein GLV88_01215 [Staphylococcus hyicus]|uniref:poly-gamma-glutamate hydrolase family protein n=1 Tax=Staphylococcus hyicus TaxID=1284 RepID=UPI0014319C45|nr:hypothetical protein [Staphylococcus hyicus]NJI31395.1 hypothetical protein [Staphylococcus hyicus]